MPISWRLNFGEMIVIRSHSLEHPELKFSGPSQGDGLATSLGFINGLVFSLVVAGGLGVVFQALVLLAPA